jgi:hypothetical protein
VSITGQTRKTASIASAGDIHIQGTHQRRPIICPPESKRERLTAVMALPPFYMRVSGSSAGRSCFRSCLFGFFLSGLFGCFLCGFLGLGCGLATASTALREDTLDVLED